MQERPEPSWTVHENTAKANGPGKKSTPQRGFNLPELLVVLVTIAILFSLVLPVMAKARIRTTGAGCLNNFRQMMLGWTMYKDNNRDFLLPFAQLGSSPSNSWCGGNGENWSTATANTNRAYYLSCLFAPYINNRIELLRCPGDYMPSANGFRIRSCSMNGLMGGSTTTSPQLPLYANTSWKQYAKGSDLTCPTPMNAFIFCDESMASLNDAYLQMNLNSPIYPDCPANYHEGAGSFSFADGHAELHRWSPFLANGTGLASLPYGPSYGYPFGSNRASSASDPDWIWLKNHTSCKLF